MASAVGQLCAAMGRSFILTGDSDEKNEQEAHETICNVYEAMGTASDKDRQRV